MQSSLDIGAFSAYAANGSTEIGEFPEVNKSAPIVKLFGLNLTVPAGSYYPTTIVDSRDWDAADGSLRLTLTRGGKLLLVVEPSLAPLLIKRLRCEWELAGRAPPI